MDVIPQSIQSWYAGLSPNGQMILWSIVKIMIVVGVVQGLVAYSVLAERKISAWIQNRVGPNRTQLPILAYIPVAGTILQRIGFSQPMADGLKFLFKEDVMPGIEVRIMRLARAL